MPVVHIGREDFFHKVVFHCYGHGGSGWTTLFGSVKQTIRLVQNEKIKTPLRVIGAGCIGLTMAIELTRLGFQVRVTARELEGTASWNAGGFFGLVSVKTAPSALFEMGAESLETYQAILQGKHYLKRDNVRYLPVFSSGKMDVGLDVFIERGLLPKSEEVDIEFGGVTHQNFVQYMSYWMDVSGIMSELQSEAKRLGILIEKSEIESFNEVSESVIVNCSGLGARKLCKDETLTPVKGHLVLCDGRPIDYMIYTDVEQEGKSERVYVFPKADRACVLGGTFIPEGMPIDDEREFSKIVGRCREFFGAYQGERI